MVLEAPLPYEYWSRIPGGNTHELKAGSMPPQPDNVNGYGVRFVMRTCNQDCELGGRKTTGLGLPLPSAVRYVNELTVVMALDWCSGHKVQRTRSNCAAGIAAGRRAVFADDHANRSVGSKLRGYILQRQEIA